MTRPFHLSLAVPDLARARAFYVDTLQCEIGRDNGTWIDVLFFGHQLTLHQAGKDVAAVAIDHFGPVLDKGHWQALLDRVTSSACELISGPLVRDEGTPSESGKFLIKDPAGNLLEFKYYASGDAFGKAGKSGAA